MTLQMVAELGPNLGVTGPQVPKPFDPIRPPLLSKGRRGQRLSTLPVRSSPGRGSAHESLLGKTAPSPSQGHLQLSTRREDRI